MKSLMLTLVYFGMLAFDAGVMAGTVWLIGWHDWSAWWILLGMAVIAGSNPKRIIAAIQGWEPTP